MAKTDKKMPLGKTIRQQGVDTITKPELKGILGSTSGSQFTQKLDKINQNLRKSDKAGIGLGAAASNMLIREASKQSPNSVDSYMSNLMGAGRLGSEIQRRATEFGTNRDMSALVSGGEYMMPSGRTANLGFGKQYTYGGGGLGKGPYNEFNMPMGGDTNDKGIPKPTVTGGSGTDTLTGGNGTDTVTGGNGTDVVNPTTEANAFDPYSMIGTKFWKGLNKKNKKGLKSTIASLGGTRITPPSSNTLAV